MRVVLIGAGKIGSGYLAPLFQASGWEVVFAARSPEGADRIRRTGSYRVRITGPDARTEAVTGCTAVPLGSEAFGEAIAGADLACTAVGVSNVPTLAEPLAQALAQRPAGRPLDVWVVENGVCAAALADAVRARAAVLGLDLPPVGFAGAVAKAAVAHGSWRAGGVPEFAGDDARKLYVDAAPLVTALPSLPGVEPTRDYLARLREKLYVFNAGHAICAYLGWLRNRGTIAEAVADPLLRPMVAGCLLESRRALLAAHPLLGTDVQGPVAEALRRFADAELADPVVRVARDPLRKLGADDRLLGPVALVREATGHVPPYFSLGVAGALLYRGDTSEQTLELGRRLSRQGVLAVLDSVCGLSPDDPFAAAVATRYRGFILTPEGVIFPPAQSGPGAQAPVGAAEGWS